MIKYNYVPKKTTTPTREIDKLKDGYYNLRNEILSYFNNYKKKHPNNTQKDDPRSFLLANPIQLLSIQRTNFELLDKSILNDEFWKLNSDKVIETKFNAEYHQLFFKFSFFILIIGHFESNLRKIESLIMNKVENQSFRPIVKIYKNIISTLKISSAEKESIITFLDLMFTLRNSIHNNAEFYPYDKSDRTIDYKGEKYEFKVGEPILYYGYEQTLFFVKELFEFIKIILCDNDINSATFNP